VETVRSVVNGNRAHQTFNIKLTQVSGCRHVITRTRASLNEALFIWLVLLERLGHICYCICLREVVAVVKVV
jgi:hypothetical protein